MNRNIIKSSNINRTVLKGLREVTIQQKQEEKNLEQDYFKEQWKHEEENLLLNREAKGGLKSSCSRTMNIEI
jgi:hypothetical protein